MHKTEYLSSRPRKSDRPIMNKTGKKQSYFKLKKKDKE